MFNTLALSSSPRSLASTLSIEDQGGGLGKDYEINLDLNDSPNYGVPNILFSPQFNHSSVSASQNSLFSPINRHTPMIRTPTTNQSSLSVGRGFSSNGEFPGSLTPYQDRNSLPPQYNSGMRGPVVQLKFESDNNEQRSPCNNRNIGESSALVSYPGNTNFSNQTMCSCTPCPDPADKVCTFCYIPLCKNCLTTNNHTCGNAPYQTRNPAFPRQNSNVAAPRTLTAIFHNGPIQVPNSPNIVSMISVNPALQASTYPQHNPSSFLPVGNSGFQQNASRQMSNYQPFNTRMRDVASGNFCPRHPFYYVRFESSRERACSVCVLKVIGTKAAQNLLSDFISLF